MKLRDLINRLEELSKNGKNDNLDVEVWSEDLGSTSYGNDDTVSVKKAYLNRYISPNSEFVYVQIETE